MVGISPDSPKSHRKFKAKYDLTYTLIADEDHAIAERYGVWVQKSMFGKKYWGVARTTFVVDPDGRIAKVFEQVKAADHAAEVADVVSELAARH